MRLILTGAALALAACEPGAAPAVPVSQEPAVPPPDVTEPPAQVVAMRADPPPPFTYWAPEGAEIRNHPTNPGIWIAYVEGEPTGPFYFGDDCGASRRQHWVGRVRADLPPQPSGETWRVFEIGQPVTSDLRPDRPNIEIDPTTQTVTSVSCH